MVDLIIIGTGIAGFYTALKLDRKYKILMISKGKLSNCNTLRAEGGMACAISPDDSPLLHAKDTIRAGGSLNNLKAVSVLTNEIYDRIKDLEGMGFVFDHHPDGSLILGLEGFHCKRRILHSFSDRIGVSIFQFLSEKAKDRSNIEFLEDTSVTDIILNDQGNYCGIQALIGGKPEFLSSKLLIIASGGFSKIYSRSTSDPSILGDMISISFRAGLELTDLEFVQFHPTTFIKEGFEPFLLTEALRGEGAILLNNKKERFMMRYHPEQELAARDIVSRAIFTESKKQGNEIFYLDLKPIGKEKLLSLFPGVRDGCQKRGIDITEDLVPVFPAAHYTMGGIRTNLHGETNIENIYAVGEVSCNGVHGANRLASNSLIDALVFAKKTADKIMNHPLPTVKEKSDIGFEKKDSLNYPAISDIRNMNWKFLGIERNETDLLQYQALLKPLISDALLSTDPTDPHRIERNIILTSYLIATVANLRKESRGAHFRSDYPLLDPMYQFSFVIKKNNQDDLIEISYEKRG